MKGYAHLALVLALLQAGFTSLAMLGEVIVMGGNPLYLPVPLVHSALLVVAASAVRKPWGATVALVVEAWSIVGFWLSVLVGALPWFVYPVNLTGLLTDLVVPACVMYLALCSLAYRGATRTTATAVLR
jgi:hypothetical protein